MKYCHRCGARAIAGSSFCHACGTKLVADSGAPSVALASRPSGADRDSDAAGKVVESEPQIVGASNPAARQPGWHDVQHAARAFEAGAPAHHQPTYVPRSQAGRAMQVPARAGGGSALGRVLKTILLIIVAVIVVLFLIGFSIGFVQGFKKGFKKGYDNTQAIILDLAPAAGHVTEPILYWHS